MNAQNRLQRIKIDAEDFEYPDEILNRADILWLISEAERLERKADDAVMLIHKLQAENEQLRAAVSKCTGELGREAYEELAEKARAAVRDEYEAWIAEVFGDTEYCTDCVDRLAEYHKRKPAIPADHEDGLP